MLFCLFRENIHELQVWFQTISEGIEKLEPISTEPGKLKQQLAETEKLQDEIQEKTHLLRNAQTEGEWMMEHSKEDEDMIIDIVTILSECQAKIDRLTAKMDQRHSRLQSAVVDSQNVEVTFAEFVDDLSRIEEQLAGMRPISVVQDTLKEQERQFEVEIVKCQRDVCQCQRDSRRDFCLSLLCIKSFIHISHI